MRCTRPDLPITKGEAHVHRSLPSPVLSRGGGRLDISARRLLEPLLDAFLLYDFYKFLRHNPYESLSANEHFTRTRDLLLARRIIDNSC